MTLLERVMRAKRLGQLSRYTSLARPTSDAVKELSSVRSGDFAGGGGGGGGVGTFCLQRHSHWRLCSGNFRSTGTSTSKY